MEQNEKLATQLALAYAIAKRDDLMQEISSQPYLHDGVQELQSILSAAHGNSNDLAFALRRTLIDFERENELAPIARLDFRSLDEVTDKCVPTDDKFRLYSGQAVKSQLALAYAKSHRDDLSAFAKTLYHPALEEFAANSEKRDIATDAAMIRLEKRNALPTLSIGASYHDYRFVIVDEQTKKRVFSTATARSKDEAIAAVTADGSQIADQPWAPEAVTKTNLRDLVLHKNFEAVLDGLDERGLIEQAEAGMMRIHDAGHTPYCATIGVGGAQIGPITKRGGERYLGNRYFTGSRSAMIVFDVEQAASTLNAEPKALQKEDTSAVIGWRIPIEHDSRGHWTWTSTENINLRPLTKADFVLMAIDAREGMAKSIDERIDRAIAGFQKSRLYFKKLEMLPGLAISIAPDGKITPTPTHQRQSAETAQAMDEATRDIEAHGKRKEGNFFSRFFSGNSGGR